MEKAPLSSESTNFDSNVFASACVSSDKYMEIIFALLYMLIIPFVMGIATRSTSSMV